MFQFYWTLISKNTVVIVAGNAREYHISSAKSLLKTNVHWSIDTQTNY